MPESPSFLEQFDRSGMYSQQRARRGPSTGTFVSISALVALLLIGIGVGAWFFVLKPDDKTLDEWLDQGLAAHVQGDLVDAAQAYQEVLLLDPTNKFAHYNLGVIAQAQGRVDEAESSYRQALATDPVYEPALLNLALLRSEAEDYAEAIELYQLVLSANPRSAKAHFHLGRALQAVGRDDEGTREIAQAIALDPSMRDAVVASDFGASAEPDTTTTSAPEPATTTTGGG